MNYDICLKLKEAGFPQHDHDVYIWPDGRTNNGEVKDDSGELVAIPTLSGLVEACGERFNNLIKDEYGWFASIRSGLHQTIDGRGSTPEEAVANLYLSLYIK